MDKIIYPKRLNAILRMLIGLFFFCISIFCLLLFFKIVTNGLQEDADRTLLEGIQEEPFLLIFLVFLTLVLTASCLSFITGILSLGKNVKNWNRELKWDLFFWISFILTVIPIVLGYLLQF